MDIAAKLDVIGPVEEGIVDAIQQVRTPNGGDGEQQHTIAQEAVGPEGISCQVDLGCVAL